MNNEQFTYLVGALRSIDSKMDALLEMNTIEDIDKFEEEFDL